MSNPVIVGCNTFIEIIYNCHSIIIKSIYDLNKFIKSNECTTDILSNILIIIYSKVSFGPDYYKYVEILLDNGADPNVYIGNVSILEDICHSLTLLDNDDYLNFYCTMGVLLLEHNCKINDNMIKYICESDCDFIIIKPLINTFITKGCNVNIQSSDGDTLLMKCVFCFYSMSDTIKLLIKHGADVSIKNNAGLTVFDIIRDIEYPMSILKIFIEYDIDIPSINDLLEDGYAEVLDYVIRKKMKSKDDEINELKKEINILKESLKLHPDGEEILKIKDDFISKAKKFE